MANYIRRQPRKGLLYIEINGNRDVAPGVYTIDNQAKFDAKVRLYVNLADMVWLQGPRGGVRVVKNRNSPYWNTGYVTANDEYMKKFFWAKMKARPIP